MTYDDSMKKHFVGDMPFKPTGFTHISGAFSVGDGETAAYIKPVGNNTYLGINGSIFYSENGRDFAQLRGPTNQPNSTHKREEPDSEPSRDEDGAVSEDSTCDEDNEDDVITEDSASDEDDEDAAIADDSSCDEQDEYEDNDSSSYDGYDQDDEHEDNNSSSCDEYEDDDNSSCDGYDEDDECEDNSSYDEEDQYEDDEYEDNSSYDEEDQYEDDECEDNDDSSCEEEQEEEEEEEEEYEDSGGGGSFSETFDDMMDYILGDDDRCYTRNGVPIRIDSRGNTLSSGYLQSGKSGTSFEGRSHQGYVTGT